MLSLHVIHDFKTCSTKKKVKFLCFLYKKKLFFFLLNKHTDKY